MKTGDKVRVIPLERALEIKGESQTIEYIKANGWPQNGTLGEKNMPGSCWWTVWIDEQHYCMIQQELLEVIE